jgi:NADH dehydrogenase
VAGDETVSFDYLLIASGASIAQTAKQGNIFDLQDFTVFPGSSLLASAISDSDSKEQYISVIGGGATGIQFLFEIAYFLRRRKIDCGLRLIHGQDRVLQQFPEGFSTYTQSRMAALDIDFYPGTRYRSQESGDVVLEKPNWQKFTLPPDVLPFLGKS